MKHVLLVTVATAALAFVAPAQAQFLCLNCTQELPETFRHVETIARWVQQAQSMSAQLRSLEQQYAALTGSRGVGELAGSLLNQGIRAPGSSSSSIPGLTYGQSRGAGADAFVNQNRYADPTGDDFEAQEIRRRQLATANVQAEALRGMRAAEQRRAGLDQLLAEVDRTGGRDIQAAQALGNRVNIEQAYVANERDNLARLAVLQRAQEQVSRQREQERYRSEAEDWQRRSAGAFERAW